MRPRALLLVLLVTLLVPHTSAFTCFSGPESIFVRLKILIFGEFYCSSQHFFFFYFQLTRPWVLPAWRWLWYLQRDNLHQWRQPDMGSHCPWRHFHPYDSAVCWHCFISLSKRGLLPKQETSDPPLCIVGKKREPRNPVPTFFSGKTRKNTHNVEKYSKG